MPKLSQSSKLLAPDDPLTPRRQMRKLRLKFFQNICIFPVLFYVGYSIYYDLPLAIIVNLSSAVLLTSSILVLRLRKNFDLSCWLFLTTMFFMLVLHSFGDGQLRSPSLWLLPLLPITASYLLNHRSAKYCFGGSILAILGVAIIESQVFLEPHFGDPVLEIFSVRIFGLLIFAAFGLVSAKISDTQIQQLQQEQRKLQESKRSAEKAQLSKSNFLATMSHEIRTPMNGILGMTQHLLSQPRPAPQREAIEMIHQCSEGLMLLLNDILDISKLDVGKLKLQSQPLDLRATVDKVIEELKTQAETSKIALDYRGLEHSAWILGDKKRLIQIIRQLVASSIRGSKANEQVSVSLALSAAPGEDPSRVVFSFQVIDQREEISDIESSMALHVDDLGAVDPTQMQVRSDILGLSLCKRLVHAMGGQLESDLNPSGRSRISLVLQLSLALEDKTEQSDLHHSSLDTGELQILIVDDNEINRKVAGLMLSRLGHECDFAESGEQAVSAAIGKGYDLIFMDIRMPGMNGFEATQAIHAQEDERQRTPIVALTANSSPEDKAASRKAGMVDHLSKPFRADDLARVIAKATRHRASGKQAVA